MQLRAPFWIVVVATVLHAWTPDDMLNVKSIGEVEASPDGRSVALTVTQHNLRSESISQTWIAQARPAIHTAVLETLDGVEVQVPAQRSTVPAYEVKRTDTPINVDGKLDDPAWADAPAVTLVNNSDGSPSPIRTEGRILYDGKFIYFGFRNADQNIWATMTKRDAHLWQEEVNEVFIQADPHQTSYIELEINPLGAIFDAFLLDVRKPLHYESWNSEKLKWAVHVDGTVDGQPGDREWTSEIALPLEDVVPAPHTPPQPGDRWRVNLYRVEQRPVPAKLAWSPTGSDFHQPSKFGEIVFSAQKAGQ